MRFRALAAAVLSLCMWCESLPSRAALATDGEAVTRTLANGLQVVVVDDPVAPVVETQLTYHFGARDETPGKTGLAHALEHMMFRGTQTISYAGLEGYLARIGARFDAHTDSDATRFDFTVPKDRLGSVLRIEADRMTHLALDPAQWNLERGAVLSELENDEDNPIFRFVNDVNAKVFAGTPYEHIALGARADVEAATAADLRTYYEAYYAPSNATLVVVGDVTPDEGFAAAERAFGAVADHAVPPRPDVAPPVAPAEPAIVDRTEDFPFEIVDLAYPEPGGTASQGYDLQNFAAVLGDPRSPFYENIVAKGLAILGFAQSADHDTAGVLQIVYVVAPGHTAAEVRAAFEAELAIERRDGPPPDLVATARAEILSQIDYARESLETFGSYEGTLARQKLTTAEDDALTAAVTPQTIAASLRRYLSRPAAVGTLVPRSATAKAVAPPADLSGAADDTFGGRVADGPFVLPADLRAEPRVGDLRSTVLPTAFAVAGMRVLVWPSAFSHTVLIRGRIRTSPASDPPDRTGLGDVASRVANYGNAVDDFAAVERRLGSIGATLTLGSSFEAHARAADFDTVATELANGLRHPAFPEKYVDLVKRQLAQILARRDEVPGVRAERTLAELLSRPGDPTLRQATPASIGAVTRADLVAYAARAYRPEETTIAVTGDVDPAHVRALFERLFGGWKGAGPAPDLALPPFAAAHGAARGIARPGDAVEATLATPAVARSSPDYDPLAIATFLLGGTFDARLMNEIRQKRGLAYSVSAKIEATRDRGSVVFDVKADPAKVRQAVAILREQLRLLGATPPTGSELDGAERALSSRFFVDQESLSAVTDDVLDIGLYGLPLDYDERFADRYRTIGPERVSAVARTYLDPARLVEVDEGPLP